jgi:hypothetical protein
MPVRILEDPIGDPQWAALVEQHPAASIFHTPGWLSALRETYGFRPFVVAPSAATLDGGLVVCQVNSWLRRRLVSLPFSDHCAPLVSGTGDVHDLVTFLTRYARKTGASIVELRPAPSSVPSFEAIAGPCELQADAGYCLHRLHLGAETADIFQQFHHSSTRRAIRRAEREDLTYESGTSNRLLASFYRLLRMTRRRHGLPPQPLAWFRNLTALLGDRLTIHVASKGGQPIAGIVTLSFKKTIVYKYGGSDATHHRLGAMPFLFWKVIQNAKLRGFEQLDLGRSELEHHGLITFKDHLGATRLPLTYYRYPARRSGSSTGRWTSFVARQIFSRLPDPALDAAGRLLYKHLG